MYKGLNCLMAQLGTSADKNDWEPQFFYFASFWKEKDFSLYICRSYVHIDEV